MAIGPLGAPAFILVDETTLSVLPLIQCRAPQEWWALLDWCRRHGMVPEQMPVQQVIFRDVDRCRVEYDEFVLVDGVRSYDAREPSGFQVRRVVAQGETPPMPFPDVILAHLNNSPNQSQEK